MSSTDNKKHILIVCQYFYPEQFRINDMASEWVKRRYKVTVVTGIPNYPIGKFYEGYGLWKRRRDSWKGVDIIRLPLIPRGHTPVGMILNYYSFPISGWWWNLFTKIKADYVFMFETSPMNQCAIGVNYAKKHNVPCYLYVQDLWPENVEIVTGIHNRAVIGMINRMVCRIYDGCTRIFATSPSFVSMIQAKTNTPVEFWPQYAEEFYKPAPKPDRTNDNYFRIVFTGNIGKAQGLEILPETAKLLGSESRVRFIIVGDGRAKEEFLKRVVETDTADMFEMIDRQPAEKIPEILAACDMGFISFENNELWTNTIPAKLQSYMACGVPVLAAAEGETQRVVEEARCGVCTPLGDAKALAAAILQIDKEKIKQMGYNGLEYCKEHFDKSRLMDKIEEYYGDI